MVEYKLQDLGESPREKGAHPHTRCCQVGCPSSSLPKCDCFSPSTSFRDYTPPLCIAGYLRFFLAPKIDEDAA